MQTAQKLFDLLSGISDPEIPVITIGELGILRSVEKVDEKLIIKITPTYSGCPAMHAIETEILETLKENNITNAEVKTVYSPVWTTDWINEEAKEKLRKYGISPPGKLHGKNNLSGDREIKCPQCNSGNVQMISQFGSTACKALYKCNSCLEPFDLFKCH
jgi:ring-1,2-phenylacetyl-CoA epoxidase subunit PaaD